MYDGVCIAVKVVQKVLAIERHIGTQHLHVDVSECRFQSHNIINRQMHVEHFGRSSTSGRCAYDVEFVGPKIV